MLRYYYINKEWMLSATARGVYRIAATLSLMLFCILVALRLAGETTGPFHPIVRLAVLSGVIGAAITTVAMEYFLFGFDKSSAWKKTFWFAVLLFPPLGPALYCFLVYSRSDAVKSSLQQRA